MSLKNGSSKNGHAALAPADDFVREGRHIQELVEKISAHPDPAAREMLEETLETVLSFYGHGLQRLLNLLEMQDTEGKQALAALLADPGLSGLLLIHGLHPVPLAERLQQALAKVRPYMESHGGDVELVALEDEHARLRLRGHCETCPSSTVTLELAVRAAIEEACPDLAGFEVEGLAPKPGSLQHVPAAPPEWTPIEAATDLAEGGFIHVPTDVEPLFVCKSGGQLYAYRDLCPACNLPLHLGEISGKLVICSLGHRYDVRRAGQSPDNPALHLDPLPLLERDGTVKVALAREAVSGHDSNRPVHDHP
jgi:Fe-S cluster biogenesis protein NfuA/nitrite reductase/ring-hydroxylating ferredoxin subunit